MRGFLKEKYSRANGIGEVSGTVEEKP